MAAYIYFEFNLKVLRGGSEFVLILINLEKISWAKYNHENMNFSQVNIQLNLDDIIIIVIIIQWILASIIALLSCPNLLFRSCSSICLETQSLCLKSSPNTSLGPLLLMLRALTTCPNAPDNILHTG